MGGNNSDEKRVADYFIISGLSENIEHNIESKPLICSVLPITDIAVIFKGLGEECPPGYTCIETTPSGHLADLNNGNFKSPNIHICFKRGNDKPPLIEVGVCHEDKERVLSDVEVVDKTPYGRTASTGTTKSGTFITYRRAKTNNPYDYKVVVDLCVILNNKSEHPPHAFYTIKKNLNKSLYGMIGSEVFLCYKKTVLSPPSLSFTPHIISRFPLQDYANFPLPGTVPLFCLPAGATIDLRPANTPLPRPRTTTFVLTSDSAQKIYGSSLTFYEPYDESLLTEDQRSRLGSINGESDGKTKMTLSIKSICILSRWPFFECFEKFLFFLHNLVFQTNCQMSSDSNISSVGTNVSLEHYISHFLLDVSFPTSHRPTVLVQLMPGSDEELVISQPSSRLPLPLTGASFIQLLTLLGVDNTMNVLLFGLCEQKILLHSLNPSVLTATAEAISAMLFPFHWQCPYVPLCPMSLCGILNAPLPFIVGIDSRCFDTFTPSDDIICVDLDTRSIFLSELKKCLNLRILPKRAARVLRTSLERIFQKWLRISQAIGFNQSPMHKSAKIDTSREQISKKIELEIQEAFLRFMATILRGFRSYLLPITRAPTAGATDPTSLFNFEGFLMSRDRSYSQFYDLITKTQMFTHYIEERSFVSDKDTSLAFFDDCEERLSSSDDIFSDKPIRLFDKDDGIVQTDRSVYIPAPEQSPSVTAPGISSTINPDSPSRHKRRRMKFGPLNPSLFHRHPQIKSFPPLDRALTNNKSLDNQFSQDNESSNKFSMARRTKQEIKASQKMAKKSTETPLDWSKYLLSCSHCLWFATLPSYITYIKTTCIQEDPNNREAFSKATARLLRYAYATIVRMQKLQLTTDEVCFRVLTLLCGYHEQPALAVRVFFEMKKAGIKPNAITYGYYNKAVLESRWPDHSNKTTTVLWTKIRNVISGVARFKSIGRMRMERRNRHTVQLIGDPSFGSIHTDVVDRGSSSRDYGPVNGLFEPTTLPIGKHSAHRPSAQHLQHRQSLVNRSFSTYQKSTTHNQSIDDALTEFFDAPQPKQSIQKSYSMHLRDESPQRSLYQAKSSSTDNEDELFVAQKLLAQTETCNRKITSTHDLFLALRERHQLLDDPEIDLTQSECLDLIDSSAGVLFSTNPHSCHRISRSSSHCLLQATNDSLRTVLSNNSQQAAASFLLNPCLSSQVSILNKNAFLKSNSFGEDTQILSKLDYQEGKSLESVTKVNELPVEDLINQSDRLSMGDAVSNRVSETNEDATSESNEEDNELMQHITSTPNFKLSTLINDASNMQWSKWTSSQNSKSVYKGIKSAATGIVSSLQEIKSSFSISNSNTPAKTLTSMQNKSKTTREMLSQWANYFSSNTSTRGVDGDEDSDASYNSSEDCCLSNEEDNEPSSGATDFRFCNRLFTALERHYKTSSSNEDFLVDQLQNIENCKLQSSATTEHRVAIEVTMSTCILCNVCNSLLYDEEIMERWSHNESNLNTKCIYCRAKIVPFMCVEVTDYRFRSDGNASNALDQEICAVTDTLVDLSFDEDGSSHKGYHKDGQKVAEAKTDGQANSGSDCRYCQQNFSVPYLSPIVLRKELENVFESSGDNCPASSSFVDEHPIIYWNLLWYFNRINVPSHLASLCLHSGTILNGKKISAHSSKWDKVNVKTMWDNDKLHNRIGKPLYRLLERGEPSLCVRAILCDELYFTRSSLKRVVDLIESNELLKAMSLVLNARLKSSTQFSFDANRHNLYRDLIFLISVGPRKLYMDNFEREYKKAFDNLNFEQVALNRFDRPPTSGSLFCRMCFKELSL